MKNKWLRQSRDKNTISYFIQEYKHKYSKQIQQMFLNKYLAQLAKLLKQSLQNIVQNQQNTNLNMDSEGLFKIQDVNSIIKLFAFSIQERFEELDGLPRASWSTHNSYMHNQATDDSEHLLRKYRNYMTSDERQIKYLEKFVIRILQILQFFKQRSKNQPILSLAIKKIQQKLNKIVKVIPIDVQLLYSCIIDLAKNGFHLKKTPQIRQRRYSLKKIQASQQKQSQQQTKQLSKQGTQQPEQPRAISTANPNPSRKRRPMSLNSKRVLKQPSKQPLQSQLSRLYSIIGIDMSHIQKQIQTKDRQKVERQQIRQNSSICTAIQNYDKQYGIYTRKKQKIDTTLREVNNRSIRPVINNWISRKRKINQCRRKPIDSENHVLFL